jgi:glycosyltransferase involved in cell wall biosynthesis
VRASVVTVPPARKDRAPGVVDLKYMPTGTGPSISAVVAAYQAEKWIAEALESILGQTRPPDEVVVVDDGSTDGTGRELERFAEKVRIIRQPNRGCPAAFNTAFAAARSDFVAMCGADDRWNPRKLEWQAEAVQTHPEVDVLFGHAVLIGRIEGEYCRPPGVGLLDSGELKDALFRECVVCAPSVVIRRSLFERLGPFVEDFGADDYEYWFRCLRAGARFYYDPRPLLSWRQHDHNLTRQSAWMEDCASQVRDWYSADVTDRAIAKDHFKTGRRMVDEGRPLEARRSFRRSLKSGSPRSIGYGASARALVWIAVLGLPAGARERVGRALTAISRAIDDARGVRARSLS